MLDNCFTLYFIKTTVFICLPERVLYLLIKFSNDDKNTFYWSHSRIIVRIENNFYIYFLLHRTSCGWKVHTNNGTITWQNFSVMSILHWQVFIRLNFFLFTQCWGREELFPLYDSGKSMDFRIFPIQRVVESMRR